MSARVCGKRVGFEELFGSSSPASSKRSKRSVFGSPVRSPEFGSASEDPVSALMRMFPAIDPELVKVALMNSNNKIEDAQESLCTLWFGDAAERTKTQSFGSAAVGNCVDIPGHRTAECSEMPDEGLEDPKEVRPRFGEGNVIDGSKWVDLFVSEMRSATDIIDAKQRASAILEAFEKSISASSRAAKEHEYASLKEHLQKLLSDNQILRRAVSLQHQCDLEREEKTVEAQHLKLVLSQYQEQVHKLELSNYALKLHLQRAHGESSQFGHFPPNIY